MKNTDKFINDVSQWIHTWVSKYNQNLNAVPCPYAKQALLDKKIDWKLIYQISEYADFCKKINKTDLNEVLVFGIDPNSVTAADLSRVVGECNQKYLIPNGLVALEDHPNDPEIIAGESMNQGIWALILVQEYSKLNHASRILEKQGYYNNWSEDNLNDVVKWRPQ